MNANFKKIYKSSLVIKNSFILNGYITFCKQMTIIV